MSGSDPPPGPLPRSPGGNGGESNCSDLRFTTTLASPDPDPVEALTPGDVLGVALVEEAGVTIIAVVDDDGSPIGSVVSDRAAQLRECLQREFSYEAEVEAVDGGAVRVRISPTE
jgi:hypothetical protein